jgi:predicted CoA-binding protein
MHAACPLETPSVLSASRPASTGGAYNGQMSDRFATRAIPVVRAGRKVEDEEGLKAIVRAMKTIVVVGMKGEDRPDESAHSIPALLKLRGYRVIPVNPTLEGPVLGERAYPDLASVPERADVLDVFRRPEVIPDLARAVVALPAERRPKVVWLQSGIRHEPAADLLVSVGIDVVQDKCLGVYSTLYSKR